jgi:hypothetical protein
MGMSDRALITWLCYQYTTCIRIQRSPENIEEKVALPDKTDGKGLAVLWLRRSAIRTATFKIQYPVKIRFIKAMNISLHETKLIYFEMGQVC